MFVTISDFEVDPFNLPNLIEVEEQFLSFAEEVEEDTLRDLLGGKLYKAFVAGLFNDGVAIPEENVEQRWKDLRDGADYTVEGNDYHFPGMAKLLRGVVTYEWLKHGAVVNTGIGSVIPDAENASNVGPALQMVFAFNKFAKVAGKFSDQCNTLFGYIYNSGNTFNDVSSNIKEYITTNFKAPAKKNRFGL